jgi:hypothetical protein
VVVGRILEVVVISWVVGEVIGPVVVGRIQEVVVSSWVVGEVIGQAVVVSS